MKTSSLVLRHAAVVICRDCRIVLLQKKCTPLLQEVKHFVQSYPAYSAYRGLVRTRHYDSSSSSSSKSEQLNVKRRRPWRVWCSAQLCLII
jgi:hypothetical protein